jgi:hypothetical protein
VGDKADVIVEPASGATCLGGETIPRKEQVLQRPQGGWTIWTRRWSKTLKPPGAAQQCAASNGGGHDDHGRGTRRSRVRVRGSIAIPCTRPGDARSVPVVLRRLRRSAPCWARPRVGFGRSRVPARCAPSGSPCSLPPGAAGPSSVPCPGNRARARATAPQLRAGGVATLLSRATRSVAEPRPAKSTSCGRMGNPVTAGRRPTRPRLAPPKSRC